MRDRLDRGMGQLRSRRTRLAAASLLCLAIVAVPAPASATTPASAGATLDGRTVDGRTLDRRTADDRAVEGRATNPWLDRRVAHFAHQGGEYEAPSNTMYAFRRALTEGADVLELDVHPTRDGELVVLHDATVDRTTNGTGGVRDLTLAEVRALDAAYNFIPGRNTVPGEPDDAYPFRGVRTGQQPPPSGFEADDFAVPTLTEVLAAFPTTPVNIEIKGRSDGDTDSFLATAELLAALLNRLGRPDVIVVSFKQEAVDHFHRLAPQIPVAPGVSGILRFYTFGISPGAGVVAIQMPVRLLGIEVATRSFIRRAHSRGYAVHVYLDAETEENDATYRRLVDNCVDGIMTAYPTRLERWLQANGIVRPDQPGIDPCAAA